MELSGMLLLSGLQELPDGFFRPDQFAVAYRFMPGKEIGEPSDVLGGLPLACDLAVCSR